MTAAIGTGAGHLREIGAALRPAEVAALVCFLCGDAADYITGQVISVGGLFMG